MITTNAIQRTFHIKVGESTGTCFTIDVDNKQYIVTAKHVVQNLSGTATISLFHENQWKDMQIEIVGHCEGEIDISVLTVNTQLSPTYPLEASSGGMTYGQDVYFLGFPYGMSGEVGPLNREFPFPFVKKAIVSCMHFTNEGIQINFLDGHNNPGFSGGPVIFKEGDSNDYKVASVISGYRFSREPIFQGEQQVALEYKNNTGIVISYGIKHAVDIINNNPIGYQL